MISQLRDCILWHGRFSGTVEGLVRERLAIPSAGHPAWLSCEPVNGPRRIPGFHGLTRVEPTPVALSVPLVEARLHYATGMLHLLKQQRGVRWAAWAEVGEDPTEVPQWFPGDAAASEDVVLLARPGRDVLIEPAETLRGLTGGATGKVKLYEYSQDGVLRWWRLGDA